MKELDFENGDVVDARRRCRSREGSDDCVWCGEPLPDDGDRACPGATEAEP